LDTAKGVAEGALDAVQNTAQGKPSCRVERNVIQEGVADVTNSCIRVMDAVQNTAQSA